MSKLPTVLEEMSMMDTDSRITSKCMTLKTSKAIEDELYNSDIEDISEENVSRISHFNSKKSVKKAEYD